MENITIEWVHAESGHRKGPPDGVDEPMKTVIDNIVSYNLKKPITNTTEIITKWPATDIVIKTYTQNEVKAFSTKEKFDLRHLNSFAKILEMCTLKCCLWMRLVSKCRFLWKQSRKQQTGAEVFDNSESNEEDETVINTNGWVIAKFASTSNRINRYVCQVKSVAADGSDYLEVQFFKAFDTKSSLKFSLFS